MKNSRVLGMELRRFCINPSISAVYILNTEDDARVINILRMMHS